MEFAAIWNYRHMHFQLLLIFVLIILFFQTSCLWSRRFAENVQLSKQPRKRTDWAGLARGRVRWGWYWAHKKLIIQFSLKYAFGRRKWKNKLHEPISTSIWWKLFWHQALQTPGRQVDGRRGCQTLVSEMRQKEEIVEGFAVTQHKNLSFQNHYPNIFVDGSQEYFYYLVMIFIFSVCT